MDCDSPTCDKPATRTSEVAALCQHHYMLWRKYGYVGSRFPTKCTVDGCGANHVSGGYCSRHYKLLRETGSLDDRPRKNARKKCSVEGCDRWRSSYGLCTMHHDRKLAETRAPVVYPGRICSWCEGEIPERRPKDAIYCSRQCKTYSMNERGRQDPTLKDRMWARSIQIKFGLTPETFDEMLTVQGGRCAICGTDDPRGRGRFHIDHCHAKNVVRGLLCTNCNTGLGQFLDDPVRLQSAIDYLTRQT